MSDFLSSLSAWSTAVLVCFTGVYVFFTYRIVRENKEIVAEMRRQALEERRFRDREHFLSGIAAIAQYDISKPGCEQAMRLLDYYSYLALSLSDDEFFRVLNTVMTAEIRNKLEEIEAQKQDTYIYAINARKHIKDLLKREGLERKGLQP
jgi:hypothetical protein